jgi:hypothetical protein
VSEPIDAGDEGDPPEPDGGVVPIADGGDAGVVADAGADDGPPDGGADAGADGGADAGTGTTGIAAGDELRATTDVNLRAGPGTSYGVILVIPSTGVSKALAAEDGGWVQVDYAARSGYTASRYEQVVPAGSGADLGSTFISRGTQSVGFNYWWGGGAWSSNAAIAPGGSCTGTCPSCTHTGSYGSDCSGMVAKAWIVPASNWSYSTNSHPFTTLNFYNDTTDWQGIDRGSLAKGDAMVYRDSSSGHVFLFESGDPWGTLLAIECKGCAAGCVRDYRTATTAYKAIRRNAVVTTQMVPRDAPPE